MKRILLFLFATLAITVGCDDDAFLNKEPKNLLLEDQVYGDKNLLLAHIASFYTRIPEYQRINTWWEYVNFDEAFGSANGDYWRSDFTDYGYDWWGWWDYAFIRELNVFMEKIKTADKLTPTDRARFEAEGRVIRAIVYFEAVKRMGGVPLITEPLTYDFSGDPSYLEYPRSKEHEIYDFVISELEAAKEFLPSDGGTKDRATKGLVLSIISRAALYAGSIARYNTIRTPQVVTAGGEVGIPSAMANAYYQKSLDAAKELINSGIYSLYMKKADNLQQNFADLFTDKNGNPEVIFVDDYKVKSGKVHDWTLWNVPLSQREEGTLGGILNPSLNLAQSFELLDNSFAPFATIDPNTDEYIEYTNPQDIFAGRDARLGGTILFPGSEFREKKVDIFAGWMASDGTITTADQPGKMGDIGGVTTALVGRDGPIDGTEFTAQTGFLVRKFLDKEPGAAQIGTRSSVWWIRYRYAEVLLNAAEAAFELGDADYAAARLNEVRQRAGFAIDLTAGDVTFDRIVHERKVELAYEGHVLWDMKRWRLAHLIWDGVNRSEVTDNPAKADEPSAMVFGLNPFKVNNPGQPNHGRYIFKEFKPGRVRSAHRFRMGNYYSLIGQGILAANPLLVKNPNQ